MYIQTCSFNKTYDNTSLRVFYEGALRSYGSSVCNRWYFTFDGAECKKPATIEGVVYVHRPKSIPIVTAILKATVTRFLKVTYVWGSGLVSVRVVIVSEMVILVGIRCLVL